MSKRSKIEISRKIIEMVSNSNEEIHKLGITLLNNEVRKGNCIASYIIEGDGANYEYRLIFHKGQTAEKRTEMLVNSIKKNTNWQPYQKPRW